MQDLYLKFSNEAEARSVLYTAVQEPVYELVPTDEMETQYVYKNQTGEETTYDRLLNDYDFFPVESDKDEWDETDDDDSGWAEGLVFVREEQVPKMENVQTGEKTVHYPKFANIDHIGTIYKPTGYTLELEEGGSPEMAPLDGYHVNVRLVDEDGSALEPYRIYPENPVRGWA